MKTLTTIGSLILVMVNGHLNADDPSAAKNKITLNLDGTSEVSVQGFIAPIEYTLSNFHVEWEALANLRAAEPEKQYPASIFQAFLPNKAIAVGELWKVQEEGVLTLLRQLHPNPNLQMHLNAGDSYGLWACLRAYNDTFADIMFRIHAEFKLKDGWFTPSQFTGHLVIDRVEGKVALFEMYVPEGIVNFDVNWKEDKDKNYYITDAGLVSQMELRAGTRDFLIDAEFIASISQEAAKRALIQRFYKSQQINWVPSDQALEMARTQHKPIHAISIDGPKKAVVLSKDRTLIEFLNENFINTWVSNVELERTPNKQAYIAKRKRHGLTLFGKTHPLTQAVMKGWKETQAVMKDEKEHSPADSLVISPKLELMGRQPINELLFSDNRGQHYLVFLNRSLAGKLPGLGKGPSASQSVDWAPLLESGHGVTDVLKVVLTDEDPKQEILSTFRTPESGHQDYTVVEIDVTAFENGGTLTINLRVGDAEAAGSFDLYRGDSILPTEGHPDAHGALTWDWGVSSGEVGIIEYSFDRGQIFKLAATGDWFSEQGSINGFLAQISVEPSNED